MSGGGKGASNQTVAYYFAPVAFAICEGPIIGLKQIWAGGNLIFSDSQPVAVNTYQGGGKKSGPTVSTSYEQFSSSTQNDIQTGGSSLGNWTCYLGTETQPADPTIGEGVAYRGVAYIVFNPLNIGPGATIPPLTFEVVTAGTLAPPSVLASLSPSIADPETGGTAVDGGGGTPIFDSNGNMVVLGAPASFMALNPELTGIARFQPISSRGGAGPYINFLGHTFMAAYLDETRYSTSPDGTVTNSTFSGYFWCSINLDSVYYFPIEALEGGGYISSNLCTDNELFIFAPNLHYTQVWVWSQIGFRFLSDITVPGWNGQAQNYQAAALNGYMFAGGNNMLLKYSGQTGDAVGIPFPGAAGVISDGINLWICYNPTGNQNVLAHIDIDGNILSSFPVAASFYYLCLQDGFIWGTDTSSSLWKYSLAGELFHQLATPYQPGYLAYDGVYLWTNGPMTAGDFVPVNWVMKIDPGDRAVIPGTVDLPSAVTTLCERAGLTQFDVSLLPPIAVNFVRGDTITARSMLTRLSQAYFFSMVDSGGILRFVPQGQPPQAVIPLEDLGYDKISANAVTPFTSSRISGVDLPRSVKIRYTSAALNWEKYEQIFALESYDSGKEITLDLPLILDDQTAYNIAALACTLPHAERMQFAFTTSYKWLAIEPGDVVTLPFGTCRILTVKMGQKGGIPVIDFTACIDGMNALAGAGYATPALPNYQPNTGGVTALLAAPANLATVHTPSSSTPHPIAAAPQMVQTVPNAGVAKMVLTEPPPLKQSDTGMRFMVGAYSTGNAFPGAGIFQSTDGGNTYTQLTTEIGGTVAGYANTVLAAPTAEQGFYTWDTMNTVDVYMLGGATLAPLTDLQVMNGGNGAMLGQELIQYAQATLMTDSLGNPFYRLSRLLRGRRGTEWAMGTHQIGEPFYAIPSALSKEPYTPPMLNNAYLYKVVMMGGDLGNAPATSYEPNGNSLRQWAVCHPSVTRDSSNDWTVSWVPRARYNGDWASGYIPTLDSDTAGWSIDVLRGTTVKRTIQVPLQQTGPWQTIYTAAMQAADGFSAGQSGIVFNIYQLSASVGRGTMRSITTP